MNGLGQIYFIRPVGLVGPIKIGFTKNLPERMHNLASASPFRLEVLVSIDGDPILEGAIQKHFASARSHYEWFHPVDELMHVIERLQAGIPLAQIIDVSSHEAVLRKRRLSRCRSWREAA